MSTTTLQPFNSTTENDFAIKSKQKKSILKDSTHKGSMGNMVENSSTSSLVLFSSSPKEKNNEHSPVIEFTKGIRSKNKLKTQKIAESSVSNHPFNVPSCSTTIVNRDIPMKFNISKIISMNLYGVLQQERTRKKNSNDGQGGSPSGKSSITRSEKGLRHKICIPPESFGISLGLTRQVSQPLKILQKLKQESINTNHGTEKISNNINKLPESPKSPAIPNISAQSGQEKMTARRASLIATSKFTIPPNTPVSAVPLPGRRASVVNGGPLSTSIETNGPSIDITSIDTNIEPDTKIQDFSTADSRKRYDVGGISAFYGRPKLGRSMRKTGPIIMDERRISMKTQSFKATMGYEQERTYEMKDFLFIQKVN
jgi:hypothetical protein